MSSKRIKLSAIILTKNESANIVTCLKTISWCDEIILIDNSTDATVALAQKNLLSIKLKIIKSPNDNFAYLRNLGLKNARCPWVFFVDADHRVSKKLKSEILALLKKSPQCDAYRIKQQDVLFGRALRFGETAHIAHILLGKKTAGLWHRRVHEKWQISAKGGSADRGGKGEIGKLKHPLLHYPHQTLEEFLAHINRWSTLDALEFKNQGTREPSWKVIVYPLGKFLYNYFWRLGFLDGVPGFIVAYVMSLHSLSVRVKLKDSQ